MKKVKSAGKLTALVLTILMLMSLVPFQAFAADNEAVQLRDGTAFITADMTEEQVKAELFTALVANPEGKDAQSLNWEYYCQGKNGLLKNSAWGSIDGFTSKKLLITYTHPSLKDNSNGEYDIRLAGDESSQVKLTLQTSVDVPTANIVTKPVTENVLLYLADDLTTDFDRFREDLFNAVYDAENSFPQDLTFEDVTFQYNASRLDTIPIWHDLEFTDATNIQKDLADGGTFRFKMTVIPTADYRTATVEFTAPVAVFERAEASLALTGKSFTYTSDTAALRESFFNDLIDWKASVLPAKENLNKDFFTVEYYAENVVLGKPGGVKKWVPLEGGTFNLLEYPAIGAGEQQIRVTFKGNSTHTAASVEQTVTIDKAKVKVTVHSTDKFADEKLPEDFVTLSSNDPFTVYTVCLGTTSSVTSALFIDLPDEMTESFFIDLLNPISKLIIGRTVDDVIENGITIAEINAVINSPELKDLITTLNIDLGVIGTILDIIDNLPSSVKEIRIGFDEPNVAGSYSVVSIAQNPNYETGVGIGMVLVKMRYASVKLTFNQEVENGKITAADAANFDFNATLSYYGVPVDGAVKYLYTGIKKNGAPYTSTTTPPAEPGFYTQTVVTIGGNYQAAPITRSFTIS